jgi:osmoprotectant transport system ATP-binding protein
MIALKNVWKSYGEKTAISSIDLIIKTGKTTVLIGESGSGKSTLLRIIIGLIMLDRGEVIIEGEALSPANLMRLRRKMGYVIQEGGLFPHLTAEGNVSIMARYLGWGADEIGERIKALSGLTNFPEDALQRYPRQVSGGQRQRVSLMRALMLDPDILLLDEPLGSLDPIIRRELQNDLKEIFRSLGKTVVMVTHDIGEAAYFAETIVFLKDGEIIQTGNIDDLVKRPADPFVTRFINAQRSSLESIGAEGD